MATITSLGIGSGLDINTIVSQLVALERKPLQQMQSQASQLQTKVSAFGQIKSLFSTLQDSSNKLNTASLWTRANATSSDEAAVATVGGASAAAGSYSVSVRQLASNQTLASAATLSAATDLVGAGTMSLQLGSWNDPPTTFTANGGSTAVPITITDTDTLQTLRDKINASGAGVTAALVSDASGVRLSLRSTATGAENGFRLAVDDADGSAADGAGLSRFAYDPPAATGGMASKQVASNALASINGIAVESESNEVSGAIDGI
ncbi:MAG: flagellar hook protein, partial [Chitinophagaceae bacterium]|nr:flagellar hook protein [Rubrivivax sp.]